MSKLKFRKFCFSTHFDIRISFEQRIYLTCLPRKSYEKTESLSDWLRKFIFKLGKIVSFLQKKMF